MIQTTVPRRLFAALAAALLVTSLAGCGKAGRPAQPPGSNYPRVYPNPALGPTAATQKEGRALPPQWDQQDLKARTTPGGAYIDPSVRATEMNSLSRVQPGSNLPNSTTTQPGATPFDQGLGPSGSSPLPPPQPTSPEEEGQPQ